MKTSKRQRKFLNQMRGMGDIPWPARKFKYPPTFANVVGANAKTEIGTCKRAIDTVQVKRGRFIKRKQDVEVRCGGKVYLRRGSLGKRRVVCVDCQARKRERQKTQRLERQLQSRFGITPRAHVEEQKASRFKRFMRKGSR